MATNKLLYDPVPTYRKFVDNQVLTDDQLNAVLDHLNYQDQLSRVLLSGVGIVCGLHISLNEEGDSIRLSGGAAVTTDGNLLKVEETLYEGFKLFKDDNVKYSRFLLDEDTTMPLWELETDTSPSDVHLLDAFETETELALDKTIAVLYLEDYLKEQEDCSPVDCDTQGREAINNIRVLLVSPENAKKLAQEDPIFSGLLSEGEDPLVNELPPIYTPRVVLNAANTASYSEFKKAYNVQFSDLADRITQLGSIELFKEVFEREGINPADDLEGFSRIFVNLQYLYDFYKDLVIAYNELRDLLQKHYAICCPDPEAFPKHVLLGSLVETENPWRHPFYPSPILNHPNRLATMKVAFSRLLLMIKEFRAELKEEIKIIPSRKDDALLGRRAIPFYYDLEDSENPASFYENWKEADTELVPNYYGYSYDFDPLDVCLDGHDFYRIEGHVGRHVMDAHEKIQEIQKEKGLAFDIKPVAIGEYPDEETIDYDKYRVYFEDLQVVLQAWNEEQQCLVQSASKFLSGFSLVEPGLHVDYAVEDANNNSNTVFSIESLEQPLYTAYGTKAKENYVLTGITEEQGTLGAMMLDNKTIESSYNRGEIIYNTGKAVEGVVENWEIDVKKAAVDLPVELLGHLKETEDHKLTDIEDFTEENLKKYIDALKAQCRQTRTSKKRFQRLTGLRDNTTAQPWIEQYEFILNRIISSCCLIKKVEVLYEKILERKQEVLKQMVLDNFITRHPGAEHKAGVPDGGTFIVLYLSRKQESETTTSLREELSLARGGLIQPATRNISALSRIRSVIRERIPHGTVIGDLCLPYICCSETPATTFVFPEQLATLRLPVDHVCIGEGEEEADHIRMDIMPADGDIKAFIQQRELSGVIVQRDNGTFFDPNQVSPDDYSKVIRFEVNGQPVEPILQLYRKPVAEFIHSGDIEDIDDIEYRNENTVAIVTFRNNSTPFDDLSFEWDFDGEIVENENAVEFKHPFNVRPGENFDFEVTLTASNGPCEDTFTKSVNIDVPDIEKPEPNCEEVTARAIEVSAQTMERAFQANQDLLPQVELTYTDKVRPVYEDVLKNVGEAFSGKMDDEIFIFIQDTQQGLQGWLLPGYSRYVNSTTRGFALMIFYELILLYFYLQACRDDNIVVDERIAEVEESWTTFTDGVQEDFPEALEALLKEDKIHGKLAAIQENMEDRFSDEIADKVEELISILNESVE